MKHHPLINLFSRLALLTIFALAAGACSPPANTGGILIEDAWVRAVAGTHEAGQTAMEPGQMEDMSGFNSAGYLVIRNTGPQADRLLGARSDVATHTEVHLSEVKDDVMTMHPVESVEIPAGAAVELKPGSYHIMLIGVMGDLNEGQTVKITLVFENAGEVVVEAAVRTP